MPILARMYFLICPIFKFKCMYDECVSIFRKMKPEPEVLHDMAISITNQFKSTRCEGKANWVKKQIHFCRIFNSFSFNLIIIFF